MTKIRLKQFPLLLLAMASLSLHGQMAGRLDRYPGFESQNIENRRVDIWFPSKVDGPYKVLIMHDGQMLFNADSTWNKQEWGVDECLDSLIQQEMLEPTIIVGIWNIYDDRHRNYFPQKPFESLNPSTQDSLLQLGRGGSEAHLFSDKPDSDDYLKFIFQELMPWLRENYPIREGAENVSMMGSSMGGLISMYAALEYPSELHSVACVSTHWPGVWQNENNPIPDAFLIYLESHQAEASQTRWYYDRGDATLDSLYQPHQDRVNALYESWGFSESNFQSKAFPGAAHRELDWQSRLPDILLFLLGS